MIKINGKTFFKGYDERYDKPMMIVLDSVVTFEKIGNTYYARYVICTGTTSPVIDEQLIEQLKKQF